MKSRYLKFPAIALAIATSSCSSYRIDDIDVTHKDPACARECTGTYSSCVSGDGQKSELLRACRDAYAACVKTCSKKP